MTAASLAHRVWRRIWPSWLAPESDRALAHLARVRPGAVVLFRRHLPDLPAAVDLAARVLTATDGRTRIAIDEEGGPVRRMPDPFPALPAAAGWAPAGIGPAAVEAHYAELGRRLGAAGVALDFAPVADLELVPDHPALRDRCFAADPETAAVYVAAACRGLATAGVGACVKHFPGHGAVAADSHHELDALNAGLETVRSREWVPFRAGIAAGAPMVMCGHFRWPAVDPDRITTFSPAVTGLLREELGFGGCIVTDDLEMAAVAADWPLDEAALLALTAGYDAVLMCKGWEAAEAAAETVLQEAERSPALRAMLDAAEARIDALPQVPAAPRWGPRLAAELETVAPWA